MPVQIDLDTKSGLSMILYMLFHATKVNYLNFDERSVIYFSKLSPEKRQLINNAINVALKDQQYPYNTLLPGLDSRFSNQEVLNYLELIATKFIKHDLVQNVD